MARSRTRTTRTETTSRDGTRTTRTTHVEVEGDRDEEWPKAFNKIELTFHCTWDGDTDKKLVDQAIDWACNRYCPIHATLSRGVKIEHHRKDLH